MPVRILGYTIGNGSLIGKYMGERMNKCALCEANGVRPSKAYLERNTVECCDCHRYVCRRRHAIRLSEETDESPEKWRCMKCEDAHSRCIFIFVVIVILIGWYVISHL